MPLKVVQKNSDDVSNKIKDYITGYKDATFKSW